MGSRGPDESEHFSALELAFFAEAEKLADSDQRHAFEREPAPGSWWWTLFRRERG